MSVKNFKQQQRKRARAHGFLGRMATTTGRNLITRRRQKGRAKLSA